MISPTFDLPDDWKDDLTPISESQIYESPHSHDWVAVRSGTFLLGCGAGCTENEPIMKSAGKGVEKEHTVEHLAMIDEPVEKYVAQCNDCGEETTINKNEPDV
jgi:hypothetical protein